MVATSTTTTAVRAMPSGAHTTTSVEAVSAVRPLKVISLVCLAVSLVLLIVALSTTWWLRSQSFRTGLFQECVSASQPPGEPPLPNAPARGQCHAPARDTGYIRAVGILLLIALALTAIAFLLNTAGLVKATVRAKYRLYKLATYATIAGVILELTALIVFPACFYVKMKDYGARRDWEVDWSYGLAWGGTLFAFGASLLLICDKEHEEVYYKEKTIYNPPPELS